MIKIENTASQAKLILAQSNLKEEKNPKTFSKNYEPWSTSLIIITVIVS
jgi:hypothetical protein